jgi:hypothetical protein
MIARVLEIVEGWNDEGPLRGRLLGVIFGQSVSTIGGSNGLGKRSNGTEKRWQNDPHRAHKFPRCHAGVLRCEWDSRAAMRQRIQVRIILATMPKSAHPGVPVDDAIVSNRAS